MFDIILNHLIMRLSLKPQLQKLRGLYKVQVKRLQDAVNVHGILSFMAVLGETDVGIFVNIGGLSKDSEKEARHQEKRRLMLFDLRRLFDLWVEYYENIPDEYRRLFPLRAVHFLAPLE